MPEQTAVCQVALCGELTISAAVAVRDELLQALDTGDEIEVDLAQVAEFDSAGIQLLIAAKREAAQRGKKLRFVGHSRAVLDLLDLTDLAAVLGDPVLITRQEGGAAR